MTKSFELVFWGGSDGIKYKRWHSTVEAAEKEARRVHYAMRFSHTGAAAHPGIIHDANGKQLKSVQ